LRDRLIAEDPGGFSRRAALRAFLSFLLSGGLLLAVGVPLTGALIGSSMAMTVSVSASEAQPQAQALSMALGIAAAIAAVCLASVASASPWAASVLLCALVFLSVVGRARGPRATAVGLLAFMGYFFALFVVARPAQIPLFGGSIAAGGAVTFIVRFAVVRESVARVHASVLDAFRARVQLLLDDLAAELESGDASEWRLRRIRRQTGEVNEAALALEEAAGRSADDPPIDAARPWLLQLLDAEVGVDMLAEAVHRIAGREWVTERRRALGATVRALQRWIEHGSPDARADVERLLAEADVVPASEARSADAHSADAHSASEHSVTVLDARARVWARVEHAVTLLLAATPWLAFPPLPDSGPRVSAASFRGGGGGMAGMHGSWPNLRLAVQATIAVALAIVVGRAISDQRWYWAVLAAFFVFIRATTFAETLSRAWQRLLGTAIGVTLGTLVAALLRQHATLEVVVALLAVLVAYALLRVSYAGMMLFITIALALLYEMMGQPVPGLMELRLAETAAGAVVGVAVAALVFPMHSGVRMRRLVADVLREVARVLVGTTATGDDARSEAVLHDRIRSVDRALAEVRNAVRPLWAPHMPWESRRLTGLARAAAELAYVTRRTRTERPRMPSPEDAEALERIGAAMARNCDAVADALVTRRAPTLEPVEPLLAPLERASASGECTIGATVRLRRDMDAHIRRLAAEASDAGPAGRRS
jgi:hypothetical protein